MKYSVERHDKNGNMIYKRYSSGVEYRLKYDDNHNVTIWEQKIKTDIETKTESIDVNNRTITIAYF